MTRADTQSESLNQLPTQFTEDARELPVTHNRCVIECRGLVFQNAQEMKGIEYPLRTVVTAGVRGDGGSLADNLDAINVALHAHGAERPSSGHAVAVAVESHRLILVHLRRLQDTRIERMSRQWQRRELIMLEAATH